MPYDVILPPDIVAELLELPDPVQQTVADELERFAESPTTLSRPSTPPLPPGYQVYYFEHKGEGGHHAFWVLFKYGADEQTIWVDGIGHIRYGDTRPRDRL